MPRHFWWSFQNFISVKVAKSDRLLAALRNHATSRDDANGLSQVPHSPTDPVAGGSQIHLTTALARLLGLESFDELDSTISLKMSLMSFTRPPTDPEKYDLSRVAQHEIIEVLGTPSNLPQPFIAPIDLFRYTTNLARTYTTNGDDSYFSVDGTNLLARFNMQAGNDYSDFWSVEGVWAPLGMTPGPQVQDAASTPGIALDLGANELAMLDVIGWILASPAPALQIVRSGGNQITVSWPNTVTGFVLQERTNLTSAAWVDSATGAANPAIIVSGDGQKFYRLFKPAPAQAARSADATSSRSAKPGSLRVVTTVLNPRKP